MAIDASDRKEWAREHFQGFENVTMPSFTPDLSQLDEEGIRRDVRLAIRHGFFSTLCSVETGLTHDEKRRFLEIAADEAGDSISVALSLSADTIGENISLLAHAEQVGCTHALLSYPHSFRPASEDEIYEYASTVIDATNLGVYLFVSDKFGFQNVNPSGVPFGVFDRLVDRPNVIAMKLGGMDSGVMFEAFERYGGKVLVCTLNPGLFPLTVKHFGQQWSGAWTVEALQTPEQPLMVEFFDLLKQGKEDEAMTVYWRLAPAIGAMAGLMAPLVPTGAYHWPLLKYQQWLGGGNGGMTRQPCMRVFQRDMDMVKGGFRAAGLQIATDSDDDFFVGRTFAGATAGASA